MRARLLLVAVLLIGSLTGCGAFGSNPRDAAAAFLAAVARGDAAAAGRLTDDPRAATELIRQVRAELRPERVELTADPARADERIDAYTAAVSYQAVWELGEHRQWRYRGRLLLAPANTEQGWSVRWRPSALHPRLGAQQRVDLQVVAPEPAPVVDRAGRPLLTPQPVVIVALDHAQAPRVAARLAAALRPFDARITEQSILDGSAAAPPDQPHAVAVLRQQDYLAVRDQIYDLPGVTFPTQRRLLGPERDFASVLLPGISSTVRDQLAGATGWRIVTINAVGTEVEQLAGQPPRPAPTVTTTLDRAVQTAGEGAVQAVSNPAVIVVLQPSTGEILAVAQNTAADARGALSLTGRYPPGSTFKIVTAAAALGSGTVDANAPVPCPGTTVIGGRLIPNNDRFDLGTVPLHTAFARSCNTTFARLAAGLGADELTAAALRMGIGRDYAVPGVTTLTGQVPPAPSRVQRAEDGFGQGRVLVTPFGMALVAATVANDGQTPTPTLIKGMPTETTTRPARPLPGEVAGALRSMLREVITRGTGTALAGQVELHGKTGTAEYGAGAHGWFVGFRGDLAFATLVVDAGSSGPALDVSGRFLSALERT